MFNLSTVIASYLIDSLSFAVVVPKYYGMADPCTYGSGSPGVTDILRSGKRKAAALTLLGDVFKGVSAVVAARLLQDNLGLLGGIITIAAVAVLAGYMQPVFFSFRGDGGVATALGVLLALSWPAALICVTVRLVMAFSFEVSLLAALTTTVIDPLIAYSFMSHSPWVAATAIIAALVSYRHKGNIENLLQDKEDKIGDKTENQP